MYSEVTWCLSRLLAVALVLPGSTPSCQKLEFTAVHGSYTNGTVLASLGPVTLSECKRVCRLYAECYGFNMLWTDALRIAGTCEIQNTYVNRRRGVTAAVGTSLNSSYYASCPEGMTYLLQVDRCYIVLYEKLSWDKAQLNCQLFNPECHLAETQTEVKYEAVASLVIPNYSYWLAGRRLEGGGLYDVFWTFSNTNVSEGFNVWLAGEPDMNDNPSMGADCLRLSASKWRDAPCTWIVNYVCEF